jgi:ribonuclease HI
MSTLKPHAWLFADGSCGAHDDMGGWAAIAVNQATGQRKLLLGVACPTTISRCELMPLVEGMRYIYRTWARGIPEFRLQVFSDSDYTVKTLNGLYAINRNHDLWAAALQLISLPMHYTFTWVPRNTLPYMEQCDAIAGAMRQNNVKMALKLFQQTDHRQLEAALPMEALPDLDSATDITKELACLPNARPNPGASSTPPISN